MLIFKDIKFIKSPFDSEAELEKVIIDNYEYLFGPNSIYLPKAKIKTARKSHIKKDVQAVETFKKTSSRSAKTLSLKKRKATKK